MSPGLDMKKEKEICWEDPSQIITWINNEPSWPGLEVRRERFTVSAIIITFMKKEWIELHSGVPLTLALSLVFIAFVQSSNQQDGEIGTFLQSFEKNILWFKSFFACTVKFLMSFRSNLVTFKTEKIVTANTFCLMLYKPLTTTGITWN